MPLTCGDLETAIRAAIAGIVHVEVRDESGGCGAKFSLLVVASSFEGQGLLERQRAVHEALKKELKELHALSMKTWTPKQWEQKQREPQA